MASIMPCYHPLQAFQVAKGAKPRFDMASFRTGHIRLELPCGQCIGCRLERSRQWALRCVHEAKLHEHNCFITLTYDDAHLPSDGGLHHEDFQKFLKRLRKYTGIKGLKYYMCGEYGETTHRPHFHCLLFGYDFVDKRFHRRSPTGHSVYRSSILESLWPFGFSEIGAVTFESAAYVARYVMKKVTGKNASAHYQKVSKSTGEIFSVRPEYNKMSLKAGGIAGRFFDLYHSEIYPLDRVVINGRISKPPRFYDKKLEALNPDLILRIKDKRKLDADKNFDDNTSERLRVKETVKIAQTSTLNRKL